MQQPNRSDTNRAVSAAVVGNVLEWYDFAVYAFVAGIIAKNFFPQSDDVTALLSSFLAYGLGFVARPLGGIVIGRLGDTRGRKVALMLTIFLMAAGTVCCRRPAVGVGGGGAPQHAPLTGADE